MSYINTSKVDEKTKQKLVELTQSSRHTYWRYKRLYDFTICLILLLILWPLMLLVALAVVIDDPSAGPVYKQVRVGRHGKPFVMYKFRTMRANADRERPALDAQNEMTGPAFKMKNDPRITRIGKFLRRASLDELMQLFNVLKGDMSIVGPRPPLPSEVEQYTDYQRLRLIVTPGLTCTWQISRNRNDIPFEQWVEMDLDWIRNRTFWTDVKIILKTPLVMLSGTGR